MYYLKIELLWILANIALGEAPVINPLFSNQKVRDFIKESACPEQNDAHMVYHGLYTLCNLTAFNIEYTIWAIKDVQALDTCMKMIQKDTIKVHNLRLVTWFV